jgi:hypothetical protein
MVPNDSHLLVPKFEKPQTSPIKLFRGCQNKYFHSSFKSIFRNYRKQYKSTELLPLLVLYNTILYNIAFTEQYVITKYKILSHLEQKIKH